MEENSQIQSFSYILHATKEYGNNNRQFTFYSILVQTTNNIMYIQNLYKIKFVYQNVTKISAIQYVSMLSATLVKP